MLFTATDYIYFLKILFKINELRYAVPENQIKIISSSSIPKYSPKYSNAIKGDKARKVMARDRGVWAREISRAFFKVFFIVFSKVL